MGSEIGDGQMAPAAEGTVGSREAAAPLAAASSYVTSPFGRDHFTRPIWSSPAFPALGHQEPSVTHDSLGLRLATPKLPIIGTRSALFTPSPMRGRTTRSVDLMRRSVL